MARYLISFPSAAMLVPADGSVAEGGYQPIFNPRWMPMCAPGRSSERLTAGIGTLFYSGFKLPKKPKRAPSEFHGSY